VEPDLDQLEGLVQKIHFEIFKEPASIDHVDHKDGAIAVVNGWLRLRRVEGPFPWRLSVCLPSNHHYRAVEGIAKLHGSSFAYARSDDAIASVAFYIMHARVQIALDREKPKKAMAALFEFFGKLGKSVLVCLPKQAAVVAVDPKEQESPDWRKAFEPSLN